MKSLDWISQSCFGIMLFMQTPTVVVHLDFIWVSLNGCMKSNKPIMNLIFILVENLGELLPHTTQISNTEFWIMHVPTENFMFGIYVLEWFRARAKYNSPSPLLYIPIHELYFDNLLCWNAIHMYLNYKTRHLKNLITFGTDDLSMCVLCFQYWTYSKFQNQFW